MCQMESIQLIANLEIEYERSRPKRHEIWSSGGKLIPIIISTPKFSEAFGISL